MLKMKDVELNLISDIDMYECIEKGMRGRVGYIAQNNIKRNNKYMKSIDIYETSKHIIYLDASNISYQYGWVITQFLLIGEFKWLAQYGIGKVEVETTLEDKPHGCVP